MVSYCCFCKPRRPRNIQHVQTRNHGQLISFQDMLGLLVRPDVGVIVIQGIGGSGKTWAAKAAYQTAMTSNIFDEYVWVSLSMNCRMGQCIDKIAACLSCNVGGGLSVERSKTTIKDYLTARKFIIVIDNAYFTEESILEHLGVPHPQQQSLGSKIIVTTRTRRTETAMMPNILITPQPLTYEESNDLLREKIGKDFSFKHDLISSCFGIPLIIILLAGVLCGGPSKEASGELVTNAYAALGSKVSVFHTLQRLVRFVYDQLPSDNVRHCFLYCLLFPEDQGIPIKDLIQYWIMDGLLREASRFHEANHIGKEILDILIKHGMLTLEDNDHVRMHDVIRETLSGCGKVKGFVEQDDWYCSDPTIKLEQLAKSTDRIPLMNTEMESLHGSPKCMFLSSLFLRGNYHLKAISEGFFWHMRMLGILDLSLTHIKVLPTSISWLTRLRMLLLIGCDHLEEIRYISSLVHLEVLNASGCVSLKSIASGSFDSMVLLKILDLSGTSIRFLPPITAATELHHLDLQGCPLLGSEISETRFVQLPYGVTRSGAVQNLQLGSVEDIVNWMGMQWLPCGMIFQLSNRFGMKVSFDANEDSKTYIYASDAYCFNCLEKDSPLWFNCFQKFQIIISPLMDDQTMETSEQVMKTDIIFRNSCLRTKNLTHSIGAMRYLEINGTTGVPSYLDGILYHAEMISLKGLTMTTQSSDLNISSMKAVTELWVENCDQLESLLSAEEVQAISAVGNLHSLWISNLENLSTFCLGVEDVTSFSSMNHLLLDCCPKLVYLFPSVLCFPNLKTLHIRFCDILERVFQSSVSGVDTLPRLQTLQLWELPELTSVCSGVFPSLKNLKVRGCSKLRKIPVGVNENNPFVITNGEQLWWDSLLWDDETIKSISKSLSKPHYLNHYLESHLNTNRFLYIFVFQQLFYILCAL